MSETVKDDGTATSAGDPGSPIRHLTPDDPRYPGARLPPGHPGGRLPFTNLGPDDRHREPAPSSIPGSADHADGPMPFAIHGRGEDGSARSDPHDGPQSESTRPAREELQLLVARARNGDPEVLPRLRAILDERPELWRHGADLAGYAERAWIELISGQDGYLKESLVRRLLVFRTELCPGPATPLEQLLVDRIVVCWLMANYADVAYAQGKNYSLPQGKYALDRQDRAHRRLLAAIAALTSVRKLLPRDSEPGPRAGGGVAEEAGVTLGRPVPSFPPPGRGVPPGSRDDADSVTERKTKRLRREGII
jgi:hypothetical protein